MAKKTVYQNVMEAVKQGRHTKSRIISPMYGVTAQSVQEALNTAVKNGDLIRTKDGATSVFKLPCDRIGVMLTSSLWTCRGLRGLGLQ